MGGKEGLTQWLMTIVAGAVCFMLLENILAEGPLKRTVHFTLALLQMLLIAAPLTRLLLQ